jgi:serine/threonine protein kinase
VVVDIDELLEPGSLFKSALFGTLLRDHVDVTELPAGTRVGPYSIERPIGSGGMGIVYLGLRADGQFEQRVAIKFLARRVAAPHVHDDFRRERKIVAALNHPHIAHLLDGGVMEDGRLWFAVELVDGLPIDAHCVVKKLTARQRVGLLLPVVAAVQYAHSRLLIHRDIKPGNVLVDTERGAQLLDFGVAMFVDERDTAMAYTPGYGSPEQLADEPIGTSSDIWQLGNLLRAVNSARAEGDVPPCIPVDLQAIIAKACARQVTRRYHTAQGLHDDLERFLSYQPVRARHATLRYRFVRLVQRHPFGIIASAVAVLLLAGIVAIGWRLGTAHSLARNEHELTGVVTHFLTDDLIGEADPYGGSAHRIVDLGNVLSKASEHTNVTFASHPHLASEIDKSLAAALEEMSRYDDARKIVARALPRLDPTNPENFELIMSLKVLNATFAFDFGNNVDSRREFTELYGEVSKTLGTLSPLALHIQTLIGLTYHNELRLPECERVFRDVLTHARELQPFDSLLATSALTQCSALLGHFDEASAMAQEQIRSTIARYGDSDPRTIVARDIALSVTIESGEFSQALTDGRNLILQARATLNADDEVLAGVLSIAGFAAVCTGGYEEGIDDIQQAKRVYAKVFGEKGLGVAKTAMNEGLAYARMGDLSAADRTLATSASILQEHPEDSSDEIQLLKRRGEVRLIQNRYADAAADFNVALDDARKTNTYDLPRTAPIKMGLAAALAHAGRIDEASRLFAEAAPQLNGRPSCWQPLVDAAKQVIGPETVSERERGSLEASPSRRQ